MGATFCEHDLEEILRGRRRWLEETLLTLGRREDLYTKPYWHSDGEDFPEEFPFPGYVCGGAGSRKPC